MQLSTSGPHARLPASIQRLAGDGSIELSTVHEPAWDLSFYTDICKVFHEYQQGVAEQIGEALTTLLYQEESVVQPGVRCKESAAVIINTAKRVTGLSIKDLAGIFLVSRQTLYNYRKSEENITDRNWARLQAVERQVATLAGILPYSPGSLTKRIALDGDTLYGLLCMEILDAARIRRMAEYLANQMREPVDTGVRHPSSVDQLTRHA